MATTSVASTPSLVEWKGMRFLISDAPKDSNIYVYLKTFKKFNATHIVRISEPLYKKEDVENAGIQLHEMHFPDGDSPPDDIIKKFLDLVDHVFSSNASTSTSGSSDSTTNTANTNATTTNNINNDSSNNSDNDTATTTNNTTTNNSNISPSDNNDNNSPSDNNNAINGADTNQPPCIVVHCVAGLGRAPVMVALALIEHGLEAMNAVQFIRKKRRGAINSLQLQYLVSYEPSRHRSSKCTIM